MLKIIKWLLIITFSVLAGLALLLQVGSSAALDRSNSYTSAANELPKHSAESPPNLVKITANNYNFRARIAGFDGTAKKPAVILLHGFPVSSAMWIPLIEPLVAAGFRVVAFDQRGYSPGARPRGIENYQVQHLRNDVIAVADTLGLQTFHLIGHDWGAVVGWYSVMAAPQRILSWTALSVAHPAAFSEALQNDPDQQSRSSYFVLFATPWLPEALFSFNGFKLLNTIYAQMLPQQRSEYLQLFSEPGALTAALNWYRAMASSSNDGGNTEQHINTPTLFIWGSEDVAVARSGVLAQEKYMKGDYAVVELKTSHWLLADAPDATIAAVLAHLQRYDG